MPDNFATPYKESQGPYSIEADSEGIYTIKKIRKLKPKKPLSAAEKKDNSKAVVRKVIKSSASISKGGLTKSDCHSQSATSTSKMPLTPVSTNTPEEDATAGWNHSHMYEDGYQPLIPAGATMIITAWHDNTENNPMNPDPDQWVGAGQRTTDEMSHAWIAVTHLDDEGYEKIVAEREERDQRALAGSDD